MSLSKLAFLPESNARGYRCPRSATSIIVLPKEIIPLVNVNQARAQLNHFVHESIFTSKRSKSFSAYFHKTTLLVVFLACLPPHPFGSVGLAQTGATKPEAAQRGHEGRRPGVPKQPKPVHPTMVNGVPVIDLMKRLGRKIRIGRVAT